MNKYVAQFAVILVAFVGCGVSTVTFLYPEQMGEFTTFNFVLLGIAFLLLLQKTWHIKRKQAEEALVQMNVTLEMRVRERTAELAKINQQLQQELYERQKVTQALQASERKFRAIFEQTFQFIGLLTPDGMLLELNQGPLDFIRARREDAINRLFWEISCWSSSVETQENLKVAIAQAAAGEFIRMEVTLPDADGNMIDFDFSLKPVRDESNQVVLLIAEGRDITNLKRTQSELLAEITERRQTELALAERENLLRSIGDNLPNGAIYQLARECGARDRFDYISAGIEKITEIKSEDILKDFSLFYNQFLAQDYPKFLQAMDESMRNLSVIDIQLRTRTPSRKEKWLHFRLSPRRCAQKKIAWDGLVIDITDTKQAEQALQLQAEKERALNRVIQTIRNSLDLQTIFNTAVSEIAKLLQADRADIIQYLPNQKLWKYIAGYEQSSDLPRSQLLIIPDKDNELIARLKQLEVVCIDDPRAIADESTSEVAYGYPGAYLLVPLHINSQIWGNLSLVRSFQKPTWQKSEVELTMTVANQLMIGIQQSELYQKLQIANQELQHLATLDGLTQIANRRCFDQYLKKEWLRLAREQNSLSLILCDVDYFKRYNDTYGHPAGDACLVKIAQAISHAVRRPADLVARYGGEEFAVLLPNTNSNGAKQVVQFIQKKIRQQNIPHIASLVEQYVTLSFGIATTFPSHKSSVQALINAADNALYQAKEKGRNCYQDIQI